MGYLSHPYAWRLRSASFAGATIERLQYRDTLDVVIRFADWRGRRFQPKALEIGEDELLVLLGNGIASGVLSGPFVRELLSLAEVVVMNKEVDALAERLEKTREEILAASTDRDAVLVAFTELATLLLDIKADIAAK